MDTICDETGMFFPTPALLHRAFDIKVAPISPPFLDKSL